MPDEAELSGAASEWQPPLPDEAPLSSPAAAAQRDKTPPPPPPLQNLFPPGIAHTGSGDLHPPVLPPGIGTMEQAHAAAGAQPVQAPPLLPVNADMLLPPHLRGPGVSHVASNSKPDLQPYDPLHPIEAPTPPGQAFKQPSWVVDASQGPQLQSSSAGPPHQGLLDSRAFTPSPKRVPVALEEGDKTPLWTGADEQLPAASTPSPPRVPVPLVGHGRTPPWIRAARPYEAAPADAESPQPGLFSTQLGFPDNLYGDQPAQAPGLSLRHFLREPSQDLSSTLGGGVPHRGALPGPPNLELRHFLPGGPILPEGLGSGLQLPEHMQGARGTASYPASHPRLPWQAEAAAAQAGERLLAALHTSEQSPANCNPDAGRDLQQPAADHVQHAAAPAANVPTAPAKVPGIAFACRAPSKVVKSKQARLSAFSVSSQDAPAEQSLPNEAAQEVTQHVRAQPIAAPWVDRPEALRPPITEQSDRPPPVEEKKIEAQPVKQSVRVTPPTEPCSESSERQPHSKQGDSSSQPQKQEGSGRPLAGESTGRPAPSALGDRSAQPQKQPTAGVKRGRDEPERKKFETGRRNVGRAPQAGGVPATAPQAGVPAEAKYPSRPGELHCNFYMRTGYCKFGMACIFDHPDLTVSIGGTDGRAGPAMTPGVPSSSIRKIVSPADVRNNRAVNARGRGQVLQRAGRSPHSRAAGPLNTPSRLALRHDKSAADRRTTDKIAAGVKAGAQVRHKPLSRATTPLHRDHRGSIDYSPPRKRPSTESVAARVKDVAQKDLKPRSRDPTPLNRDRRPSSRDKTPTAERRSAERVAARKDVGLRDQRPRSRDPMPLRRDARQGSRDRTPAAERRSLERIPTRLKTDGRRSQDPSSRDPTPPSRNRRSGAKEHAAIAERRSTDKVAMELHDNTHRSSSHTVMPERRSSQKETDGAQDDALIITFDTPEHKQTSHDKATASAAPRPHTEGKVAPRDDRRSSEKVPAKQEVNAGKDRKSQQLLREERLHQLHEARRAGRMSAERSSKRSRSRSQSRRETPPKRACVGSGLRKASGPQDSSTGQRSSDQQASRPSSASGKSLTAKVTAGTACTFAGDVLPAVPYEAQA